MGAGPGFYFQRVIPGMITGNSSLVRVDTRPILPGIRAAHHCGLLKGCAGRMVDQSAPRRPETRDAEASVELSRASAPAWIYPASGGLPSFRPHVMIDARGLDARSAPQADRR